LVSFVNYIITGGYNSFSNIFENKKFVRNLGCENMEIDIEQCRQNDVIKDVISRSKLPIKHIKLLLRISDAIYINAINYNVAIDDSIVAILLISSKPENIKGIFNTTSLTNVLFRIKDMEKENIDIKTQCIVQDDMLKVIVEVIGDKVL
jgi:hypothetical protein